MKKKKAGVLIVLAVVLFGVYPIEAEPVLLSEITTSSILDSNVSYYIPNPPLLIHGVGGEEIYVVIPSGTRIVSAMTSGDVPAIWVYDNASIQMGEALPKLNVQNEIFAPGDTNNPLNPVQIVGESGNPFSNNQYGIVIDSTAGNKCLLNNVYLRGFNYAAMIDKQLEYPLLNVYVYDCNNGIFSFGQNDIFNSFVHNFDRNGTAYAFIPQSWDGSITYGGMNIHVKNLLADNGGYGYEVYGLPAGFDDPNFYSEDCAATNCFSGFNAWNGYATLSIMCSGFYNNTHNTNDPCLPVEYPIYEINNPLVFNGNDYRIFLEPNSQFVNHGSGQSSFPGWTTRIDGIPDINVGDIWPHYQTNKHEPSANLNSDSIVDINDLLLFAASWLQDSSNAKADLDNSKSISFGDLLILAENWLDSGDGDIDKNGIVNFKDFSLLAGYWRENVSDPVSADINCDEVVNFLDYAIFANQWQTTKMSIKTFNLETLNSIEPNNINGNVGICLENIPSNTEKVFVYLDNVLIGSFVYGWNLETDWIGVNSKEFLNGWHTIRLVNIDYSSNVSNFKPIKVRFNNLLYKVSSNEHFSPTENFKYSGFYDGSKTIRATVTNVYGSQIWTNDYVGPHINIVVPGSTFGTESICNITISEVVSGGMTASMAKLGTGTLSAASDPPPPPVAEESLTRRFDPTAWTNLKAVIILPDEDVFTPKKPAILACAQAFQNRLGAGLWTVLYYHDVTPENLNNVYGRTSLKYVYWCGHANSMIGNVQRTNTYAYRLVKEGIIWDSYEQIGAFSWTRQTRSGYPILPGNWDNRGFDLWGVRVNGGSYMHDTSNKKIVFVDGCLSGKYDDMVRAYGVFLSSSAHDQIYIGWDIEVTISSSKIKERFIGDVVEGVKMFWEQMGTGSSSTNNVWDAFYYLQIHGYSRMKLVFFGDENALFDGGSGDDHIRIMGNGSASIHDIRLQP